jgi:glucuronokinase
MDFSPERSRTILGFECGVYEPMDPALLPPLYIAYSTDLSGPTEVPHSDLRARFDRGDPEVVDAMKRFAQLTDEARRAILDRDAKRLGELIDANFDLRKSICRLPKLQEEMVCRARDAGASAKFAGSGGAIIGTYPDEATFRRLQTTLAELGCNVLVPKIIVGAASGHGQETAG